MKLYEDLLDQELLLIWEFSKLPPEKKKIIIEYIKSILDTEAEYLEWINMIRGKIFEERLTKTRLGGK